MVKENNKINKKTTPNAHTCQVTAAKELQESWRRAFGRGMKGQDKGERLQTEREQI